MKKEILILKNYINIFLNLINLYFQKHEKSEPSWFGFPLTVKNSAGFNRQELLIHYQEHNIGNRLLFAGILKNNLHMKKQI